MHFLARWRPPDVRMTGLRRKEKGEVGLQKSTFDGCCSVSGEEILFFSRPLLSLFLRQFFLKQTKSGGLVPHLGCSSLGFSQTSELSSDPE